MSAVVDVHTHFLPESWENLAERFGEPDWPWMKHLGCGKAVLMIGDKDFRPVCSTTWDARQRLEKMNRAVGSARLREPDRGSPCRSPTAVTLLSLRAFRQVMLSRRIAPSGRAL